MSLQGSIADARELLFLLAECERIIKDQTSPSRQATIREVQFSIYQLYIITRRLLASFRRFGLPEHMEQTIATIQRLNLMLHTLYISIMLLESTSTFGLIKGATGLITVFSMLLQEQSRSFG